METSPQEWTTPTLTQLSVSLDTAVSTSGAADGKGKTVL